MAAKQGGWVELVVVFDAVSASAQVVHVVSSFEGNTTCGHNRTGTFTAVIDEKPEVEEEYSLGAPEYEWSGHSSLTPTDKASTSITIGTNETGSVSATVIVTWPVYFEGKRYDSKDATASCTVKITSGVAVSFEPGMIGLDRTDKGETNKTGSATATLACGHDDSFFKWTERTGACEIPKDEPCEGQGLASVTYQTIDKELCSGQKDKEKIEVTAIPGGNATTNFTVVKVDVTIDGVGEDKEETEGTFIIYVADENGKLSEEGKKALVDVSITVTPTEGMPSDDKVKIEVPDGFLWEKNGSAYTVAKDSYLASEIKDKSFFLHGHEPSKTLRDGVVTVTHLASGATDASKFTVCSVQVDSVDERFAPGETADTEKLDVKYTVLPKKDDTKEGAQDVTVDHAKVEIFTNGSPVSVYMDDTIGKSGTNIWQWSGKDANGGYTGINDYTVRVSVAFDAYPGIWACAEKPFKIEVESVAFTNTSPWNIIMNNPDSKEPACAVVKLKKKDGSGVVTSVPVTVDFSFEEGAGNVAKTDSYEYSPGTHLGKKGDANAVHWAAHTRSVSEKSTDGFKKVAQSVTVTTAGDPDLGKAFLDFLPSAVGGDTFIWKATVKKGSAELKSEKSPEMTVWRKVEFGRKKMVGENHIDNNTSEASIRPYYETTAQTYVQYNTNPTVTELTPAQSVKYIGLWDTSAPNCQRQNWAAKVQNEIPSVQRWFNATNTTVGIQSPEIQSTARFVITGMAQKWVNRIGDEQRALEAQWIANNAPANTIIAIRYYHPKFSPEPEGLTSEWPRYDWLKVDVGGYDDYPDERWRVAGGKSHGTGKVTIPRYMDNPTTRLVTAHEVGHATRSFFKREYFGGTVYSEDHTSSPTGLMYPTILPDGGTQFNKEEQEILKGKKFQ